MTAILALTLVLLSMSIGDVVSAKTKAFVPSVFVTACIFLVGFWYVFPQNMIALANLSQPFAGMAMYLLITHMGTLMSIRELLAQWKTVLIAIAGVIGIIVFLMTLGVMILGRDTAIVGAPPLTGGIVAAILMQAAALEAHKDKLAILAILTYVAQGFVGYPITALLLKKEGKRLLLEFRLNKEKGINLLEEQKRKNKNLKEVIIEEIENQSPEEEIELREIEEIENLSKSKTKKNNILKKKRKAIRLIPPIPEKYDSIYVTLLRLSFVAWLADVFTKFLNINILHNPKAISPLVMCLIFGVLATEIGITEKKSLEKASSFGWIILTLMAFIFEGLNKATPQMLGEVIGPLAGVIVIGVIGLLAFAWIVGKVLKESKYMSLPIALNALYGFPPNFILTNEAIKSLTDDKEEQEYLDSIMMPKMLIGGFTSVTIASVLVAGIFAGML